MRRLKCLVRDEEASELVEFVLAVGIFLTLIFGIIELCVAIYAGSLSRPPPSKGPAMPWSAARIGQVPARR